MQPTNSTVTQTVSPRGKNSHAEQRNPIAEWTLTIILLLFLTTTLARSYVIPTESMEDTLLIGDHLLVDKLAYAPAGSASRYLLPYQPIQRGDIIVFRFPLDISQTYVKRVVGIPGDRIRLVHKQVYRNGEKLYEPYTSLKTQYIDPYRDDFPSRPNTRLPEAAREMLEKHVVDGEVVVPPGKYFAMGDNRDLSSDSRYWGFVPRENIIGKPLIIFWSYDAPTAQLANPTISIDHVQDLIRHFFPKTRWGRTFTLIHGYSFEKASAVR